MTEQRAQILELANEYERGLAKMEASGYEEFAGTIPKHKLIIAALRLAAQADSPAEMQRIVPHEDCLNCRCTPEQQCEGVEVVPVVASPAAQPVAWRYRYRAYHGSRADEWATEVSISLPEFPVSDLTPLYATNAPPDWIKYVPDIVKNAMLTMWNYICDDTKCHPLDIEHGKGKLFLRFTPRHWAQFAGDMAAKNIADLTTFPAAQPVAWRWRQKDGTGSWIYDPEPTWLEAHRHEIQAQPLYAIPAPAQAVRVTQNDG